MKILYISVHAVLEHDELTLFTELGHECFSLGAYTDPAGHYQLPRPAIKGMMKNDLLMEESRNMPRTELTFEFVNKFDAVVVMDGYHGPTVIERNWPVFKGKKIIWRTIGQSIPEVEKRMKKFRQDGLKIVRYSPMEEKMDDYIGGDAMIRFYKDPEGFKNWTGHAPQVINLSQSLKARRDFCGYDAFMKVVPGFAGKVYGSGNEDLGEFCGGELSYDAMKGVLRDCRVYFYTGTWPASYTLGFMEAMVTGIPIVSVGFESWRHKDHARLDIYEVPHIIRNGDNGFVNNNPEVLKDNIRRLLEDRDYAKKIGDQGRQTAINLFGKEKIREQWRTFFKNL